MRDWGSQAFWVPWGGRSGPSNLQADKSPGVYVGRLGGRLEGLSRAGSHLLELLLVPLGRWVH